MRHRPRAAPPRRPRLGRIREWERIETLGSQPGSFRPGLGRIREWERIETRQAPANRARASA
ncbi:hypothetical protein MTBUT4_620015 [Magnetospirillum sp. UT-4]|nr:hypothetical protein MTBUT4_620015 [Magnetospirillum sp. UT-4]